jgi:ABC-type Fe3+/spermidine/putrescine transport system ATPase subunit
VVARPNGAAEIELGQGVCVRADLTPDQALTTGQKVTVAVRPEKLHLSDSHPNANEVPGRVEEVVYIGTDTQYGVRLRTGHKVRVRAQNHDPFSRPAAATGEAVTVAFVPQAARVLVD